MNDKRKHFILLLLGQKIAVASFLKSVSPPPEKIAAMQEPRNHQTPPTAKDPRVDYMAIGLSSLCLLHCLAIPLLAIALPVFAVVAEAEWLHKIFVALAFPVSGLALLQIRRHHIDGVFIVLALVGLALLFASAFLERFHPQEQTFTIIGALSLSAAHLWRLSRHKH